MNYRKTLQGKEATKHNILTTLKEMISIAQPGDQIILNIDAHPYTENKKCLDNSKTE